MLPPRRTSVRTSVRRGSSVGVRSSVGALPSGRAPAPTWMGAARPRVDGQPFAFARPGVRMAVRLPKSWSPCSRLFEVRVRRERRQGR